MHAHLLQRSAPPKAPEAWSIPAAPAAGVPLRPPVPVSSRGATPATPLPEDGGRRAPSGIRSLSMHRPAPFAGFEAAAPRLEHSSSRGRSGDARSSGSQGSGERGAEEAVLAETTNLLLAQVDATRRKYAHEAESLKVRDWAVAGLGCARLGGKRVQHASKQAAWLPMWAAH